MTLMASMCQETLCGRIGQRPKWPILTPEVAIDG